MKHFNLLGLFFTLTLTTATATWADLDFEFSQIIDTGLQGSTIDSGDLDGDGDIDLAVANIFGHSITIAFNDGDGNFENVQTFPLQNGLLHPVALAVGDIDGDGLDDIAIGQIQQFAEAIIVPFDFPALVVWFNDGGGNFTQVVANDNLFGVPSSVYIADYDNDGLNDVVMGNNGTQSFEGTTIISIDAGIDLFQNTGNRTFSSAVKIERQGAFVDLIAFDFNSDGFNDIFGINQGLPQFTADLQLILEGIGVASFVGSGAGILPLIEFPLDYPPHDLDAIDFDGDGDIDISVTTLGESDPSSVISFLGRNSSIEIFDNIGPIFSPGISIPIPGIGHSLNSADFDMDGDIDFIVTVQDIEQQAAGNLLVPSMRLIQNDDGVFSEIASFVLQEEPEYSCKADFDGDGDLDIAVLCSITDAAAAGNSFPGQVYVYTNNAVTESSVPGWELY